MSMIFVNLPVKDLPASQSLLLRARVRVQPGVLRRHVRVHGRRPEHLRDAARARQRFRDFINGEISDATRVTEVLTCLTADSREQVDETVARAIAAGGKPWKPAVEDGPMYGGELPGPRRPRLGAHAHGAGIER